MTRDDGHVVVGGVLKPFARMAFAGIPNNRSAILGPTAGLTWLSAMGEPASGNLNEFWLAAGLNRLSPATVGVLMTLKCRVDAVVTPAPISATFLGPMCRIDETQFAADVLQRFAGTVRHDNLPDDWNLVSTASSNVWFVGDSATTADLVDALRPHLAEPVITVRSGDSLILPNVNEIGTLVLFDVEALGLADQQRLNAWLDQIGSRPRMISASRASVQPMIEAGTFLESLYYRLNTLCLDVGLSERSS